MRKHFEKKTYARFASRLISKSKPTANTYFISGVPKRGIAKIKGALLAAKSWANSKLFVRSAKGNA